MHEDEITPEEPQNPEAPENQLAILTGFTPVPRQRDRSDGWKPEVPRAFIEALADTGSVRAACRVIGRTDIGAYQLRRHPEGAEFAAAWDAALEHGIRRLEDALMERALNGVEVPVFAWGELVGKRTVYNDRLGMFMLRNRLPGRYCTEGARGLNAIGKMDLERAKKEWQAERDREEQEAEQAAIDQLPPRDGTPFLMRLQHRASEERLALGLGDQPLDDRPIDMKRRPQFLKAPRFPGIVDPRQHKIILRQAGADDPRKIRCRKRPNRHLRPARDRAGIIEHSTLDGPIGAAEGNRSDEVEIRARLNQRQEHARRGGIGDDLLDLRHGEIAARPFDFARFEIDDPIPDARFGAAKILCGELIPQSWDIVVN